MGLGEAAGRLNCFFSVEGQIPLRKAFVAFSTLRFLVEHLLKVIIHRLLNALATNWRIISWFRRLYWFEWQFLVFQRV